MARKQRKAKAQRRQTHAEFVDSNVHYLPQAQKQKQVLIQGRNPNQKEYIQKLLDPQQTIIFATGPAGTGKTMLAVLAAVKALNAFVIADEMQNATPGQMKMLLTRIGDDSRMAITGDIAQTDRQEHENGLMDFQKLYAQYSGSKYISVCAFDHFDIERHPAVAEVLDIYGDK